MIAADDGEASQAGLGVSSLWACCCCETEGEERGSERRADGGGLLVSYQSYGKKNRRKQEEEGGEKVSPVCLLRTTSIPTGCSRHRPERAEVEGRRIGGGSR